MKKNIENLNSKGQYHGYQEWYYSNGELWYKGFCYNGELVDYEEFHYYNSKLILKRFFI